MVNDQYGGRGSAVACGSPLARPYSHDRKPYILAAFVLAYRNRPLIESIADSDVLQRRDEGEAGELRPLINVGRNAPDDKRWHRRLADQFGLKKVLLTMLQPVSVFWSIR